MVEACSQYGFSGVVTTAAMTVSSSMSTLTGLRERVVTNTSIRGLSHDGDRRAVIRVSMTDC